MVVCVGEAGICMSVNRRAARIPSSSETIQSFQKSVALRRRSMNVPPAREVVDVQNVLLLRVAKSLANYG